MPYRYERFSSVTFALYDSRVADTTGRWDAPTFRLSSGGAFDALGSGRGRRDAYDLTLTGDLVADSVTAANAQVQTLKALARLPGRLYRTSIATGQQYWALARLLEVTPDVDATSGLTIVPVTLSFRILSPAWYGVHHSGDTLTWDSGILWDSGHAWGEAGGDVDTLSALSGTPQTIDLLNEGTLEVTAVTLTITAGTLPITSVRITGNGTDLTWTGTLVAGAQLVIDGATERVTNNGTLAYSGLTFNAGHTNDDLFVLAANDTTTYQITGAGGGSGTTIARTYDAAYP